MMICSTRPRQKRPALLDDRLRLIFTCCHPALSLEARVALTLRVVARLETSDIARAFLVSESTMAQRLVRAKRKIRDARIPYEVPGAHHLQARLSGVLTVLYLVFNEGYETTSGDALFQGELCSEAIRLTRLVSQLIPDEPEVLGMLALMLLHDARRGARVNARQELVLLADQDRALWDHQQIAEGLAMVDVALRHHRPGPYQIQAAIAALHVEPATAAETDWRQIAILYKELRRYLSNPIVTLNHAVAVAMAVSPDAGLRLIEESALQQIAGWKSCVSRRSCGSALSGRTRSGGCGSLSRGTWPLSQRGRNSLSAAAIGVPGKLCRRDRRREARSTTLDPDPASDELIDQHDDGDDQQRWIRAPPTLMMKNPPTHSTTSSTISAQSIPSSTCESKPAHNRAASRRISPAGCQQSESYRSVAVSGAYTAGLRSRKSSQWRRMRSASAMFASPTMKSSSFSLASAVTMP